MTKKGFKQIKWTDRLQIEALLKAGNTKKKIADVVGVDISSIFREINRGKYTHLNSDLTTEVRYSPNLAQQKYEDHVKKRGRNLKIDKDIEYANYIESKVANEGYSPEAVLEEMKKTGKDKEFKTRICTKTFYNYIDQGVFLNLTNKDLPVKRNKKRGHHKVRKIQKRVSAGTSIEKRPKNVDDREEFGHWEMDSVIGKKGVSKSTMVVLTERKTRDELVFKAADKSAEEVVRILDELEDEWGELFPKVFKTITVDNGTEFAYTDQMEQSRRSDGKRTYLYYCHPYSSWERGSNENLNRMIRRKVPKGTNFDGYTEEEIREIQDWINNYPRRIHGFKSAAEMFQTELAAIQ